MERFDRVSKDSEMIAHLGQNKALGFLSSEVSHNYQGLAGLDYQFREKNIVSLYCGKTAILTMKFSWAKNQVTFSAHKTYTGQQPGFFEKERLIDSREINDAVQRYVSTLIVNKCQWGGEGLVQAKWLKRLSLGSKNEDEFIIFDREGVLGFDIPDERVRFFEDATYPLVAPKEKIASYGQQRGWAQLGECNPSEIDFLGTSMDGHFLYIIEAKQPKSGPDKIYYSPLQVATYALAWKKAIKTPDVFHGVNRLILAKQKAGLLPKHCNELKEGAVIVPILILPTLKTEGNVSKRLKFVMDEIRPCLTDDGIHDFKVFFCDFDDHENPRQMDI